MKHGSGSKATEDRFEGHFVEGKRHGPGKKINADGSLYEGDYKNDLPDGEGWYKWVDGEEYKGKLSVDSKNMKNLYNHYIPK